MKVAVQHKIALVATLALTALVGLAVHWAHGQALLATRRLDAVAALARSLSELRLLTFEFSSRTNDRVLDQWSRVQRRVQEQLADPSIAQHFDTAHNQMAMRLTLDGEVIGEFRTNPLMNPAQRQLLTGQMLIRQQDNLTAAYGMVELSSRRIVEVNRLAYLIGLIGLALIVLNTIAFAVILHRKIILPIQRLQATARNKASGHPDNTFLTHGNDEVSLLADDLEAMSVAQRQLLQQQTAANQQLANLNRELESFSYSVSHDLRGPLRSMDGFALCLLEDYEDKLDADGKDALLRIRNASQRMGHLIDDMLALSQITRTELNRRKVDLSAMATEIARSLDDEHPEPKVNWKIEPGLMIDADAQLLKIAMINLMRNAQKFTSKVSAPVVEIERHRLNDKDWIAVKDNGVGFDMRFIDQLFGVFKRLHNANDFPGTGVGLAIVKRVMHRHGGEVFAESVPGLQTIFYFHTGED